MGITSADLAAMQARLGAQKPCKDGVAREADLHEQISKYCRVQGWLAIHSRMDKRQTSAIGTPDFIIATNGGRTHWIECKRKGGKLTAAQAGTLHWLKSLGHSAHCVSSMEEFLRVIQ